MLFHRWPTQTHRLLLMNIASKDLWKLCDYNEYAYFSSQTLVQFRGGSVRPRARWIWTPHLRRSRHRFHVIRYDNLNDFRLVRFMKSQLYVVFQIWIRHKIRHSPSYFVQSRTISIPSLPLLQDIPLACHYHLMRVYWSIWWTIFLCRVCGPMSIRPIGFLGLFCI